VWTEDKKAEAQDRICAAIASGPVGLDKLCNGDSTLPHPSTVREWLIEDESFAAKYTRAREAQADCLAAEILEIADGAVLDWAVDCEGAEGAVGDHARRVKGAAERAELERRRQQIDARKWTASKLAPKVYGDRLNVDGGLGLKIPDDQLESRIADLFRKAGAGATSGGTGET
jgi:hypothetical protein